MRVFIFLFLTIVFSTDVSLLHYKFKSGENVVINTGVPLTEYDSIELHGPSVDGSGIQLDIKSTSYYSSKMLPFIRKNLVAGDGFNLTLDVKLQKQNNVKGEFCIFCLMRKEILDVNRIDICHDIDFGIIWRDGYLRYVLRTSKTTPTCGNLNVESFINPNMLKTDQKFYFTFNKEKKSIYYGNQLLVTSNSVNDDMDILNWADEHMIFIGAKQPSYFNILIQLNEIQLLQKQVKNTNYAISPLQNFNSRKDTVKVKTPDDFILNFIDKSPKKCDIHDIKCLNECVKPNSCGGCGINESTCPTFNGPTTIPSKCVLDNSRCFINPVSTNLDIFEQEYIVSINTPDYDDKSNVVSGDFICLNGKKLISKFVQEKVDITPKCDKTKQVQYTQKVKFRELYECFTGKVKKLDHDIRNLHGILNIRKGLLDNSYNSYKSPCTLRVSNHIQSSANGFLKNSIITASHQPNDVLFTFEETSYMKNDDVYAIYKTCYNYYSKTDKKENTLTSINLNNPSFSITDIESPIAYLSKNNPLQCNLWKIKSNSQYLLNKRNFTTKLSPSIVINGRIESINMYINFGSIAPLLKKAIVPVTTENKWNQVLCLFNNDKMTIPYRKIRKNQMIYFRAELVPTTDLPTYHCGSKRCFLPSLSVKLQSLGNCVPRKAINRQKDIKCSDLNGDLTKFIDLSDPMNEVWNKKWDPKLFDNGCSSAVTGSFVEQSHSGKLFMFNSVIQIALDVTKIANYEASKNSFVPDMTHHFISPTIIGGCPVGLYYDELYFLDCVQLPFWYWGWFWGKFRYFMIGAFITFLASLITWMCYKKSKMAHKHHMKQKNQVVKFVPVSIDKF